MDMLGFAVPGVGEERNSGEGKEGAAEGDRDGAGELLKTLAFWGIFAATVGALLGWLWSIS